MSCFLQEKHGFLFVAGEIVGCWVLAQQGTFGKGFANEVLYTFFALEQLGRFRSSLHVLGYITFQVWKRKKLGKKKRGRLMEIL